MTTKERIKRRLDTMPDDLLEKVEKYLNNLSKEKSGRKKLTGYRLKGQLDNTDIRKSAYE